MAISEENRPLIQSSLVCVVVGVVSLLVHEVVALESKEFFGRGLLLTVSRELGVATVIAFVLNLTIEYINRKNVHSTVDRINKAVHRAVLKRSIPEDIYDECERVTLTAKLYRYTQRVFYRLSRIGPDSVRLGATWSYYLSNMTKERVDYPLRLSVYRNPRCPDKCLIEGVSIDGKELSSEEMAQCTKVTSDHIVFERNVYVKPGVDVKVELRYAQVHTGQQSFEIVCCLHPSRDMYVDVFVPDEDFTVACSSMHPSEVIEAQEHDNIRHFAWRLPVPSLPGQGMFFFWQPREATANVNESQQVC